MIELYTIQGENIELESSEVTIELNNSLFNDGSTFRGSNSFPIRIAFTDANRKRLGFADQLEVKVKKVDIPVYAKAGTKTFRRCLLNLSVSDKRFEGFLKLDIGTINDRIKTTKLPEVPFEAYFLGNTKAEIEAAMMAAAAGTSWRDIPYTFFPVRNPAFCGDVATPEGSSGPRVVNYSLINSVNFTSGACAFDVEPAFNLDWNGNHWLKRFHVVPFFYLPYILQKIAHWLGHELKGDFIMHPDVARTVVYNVNATLINGTTSPIAAVEESQGIYFAGFEHLPDMTVSDFFKALSGFFCCRIKLNSRASVLDISWKKSVFTKPVYKDWSEKLVRITDHRFVESEGYRITAEVEKLDNKGAVQAKDEVLVGYGKEANDLKAGTLPLLEEQMPGAAENWQIPHDNRAGNIMDVSFIDLANYRTFDSKGSFPLRFLFTAGMGTFPGNSKAYPIGTTTGVDFDLTISGDHGLFSFGHKPWMDKIHGTKIIRAIFRLNENDLNGLEDEDIIIIPSENGSKVQCLLQKLTFTASGQKDTVTAEAEMIVLDSANIKSVTNEHGVFARLEVTNVHRVNGIGTYQDIGDVRIKLFADKFCTIPYVAENLPVFFKATKNWRDFYDQGTDEERPETVTEVSNRRALVNGHTYEMLNSEVGYFVVEMNRKRYNETVFQLCASPNYIIVS